MDIIIYEDYKNIYKNLNGHDLTDALISKAVGECVVGVCDFSVVRSPKGKPLITGVTNNQIHVSVSHCLDTFACIISDFNCGLDIQNPRDINYLKIAERFYDALEIKYVKKNGKEGFYKLWTRKEAYAKYIGTGIIEVLRGTDVLHRDDVTFDEGKLDNGMYYAICKSRKECT